MLCRLGVVAGFVLALVCGVTGVAGAEPAVDLEASVSFDRDAYLPGEDVHVTLRVTNNGTADADRVVAHVAGNTPLSDADLRSFSDWGPGAPGEWIAAGQSKAETFSFLLPAVLRPVLEFTVSSADGSTDRVVAAVPVPGAQASLGGVLYGDKDADGAVDPGEALTGVQMTFHQTMTPWDALTVRSGAGGRYTIPELVTGEYYLSIELPPGWRIDDPSGQLQVNVGAGANTLDLRALRALKPTLDVSVRFDRSSYAVGDTIREHVRITNTGKADVSGITALCTGPGNPNELYSAQWGDLAPYTGAGVTVRAGETREFTFTDTVPQGAYDYGNVHIYCVFSVGQDYGIGVTASAEAAVPGGRGDLTGKLYLDSGVPGVDGKALAKVKVYILTKAGKIVARATTGADGVFAFHDVPAATYELRFVGPWRYLDKSAQFWNVVAGQTRTINLVVVPGPTQPDPDAPPPGDDPAPPSTSDDTAPRPQARASGLADTGADVRELTGYGIGLLLVGFWLLTLPMRARREP